MADVTDSLTNDEILRYSRQLILPEFGVKSQKLIKRSSALIVGCGGLGCPSAIYLAAAGIGTLGLLDHDDVEITNLHRQILHKESSQGQHKCQSAKNACASMNSTIKYVTHHVAIGSSNALDIISQYDVVLDCTDNVATRYLLNDACVLSGKPLVSGAALKFEGQLTVYNYQGGPCYRCLYPTPPPAHTVTSCSEGGVLGVIPGIIGTMQAQEAIKILASIPGVLSGRLFIYDGLSFMTRVIKLRHKQSSCSVCGDAPTITELIDYVMFCGSQANDKHNEIKETGLYRLTVSQYKKEYLDNDSRHVLIDTRPTHELEICQLPNTTNIPLNELVNMNVDDVQAQLPDGESTPIVCICHHGNDSQIAAKYLKQLKPDWMIADIIGGLERWSANIDSSFPRY